MPSRFVVNLGLVCVGGMPLGRTVHGKDFPARNPRVACQVAGTVAGPGQTADQEARMAGASPYGQLQYRDVHGSRMAYVDQGECDAIVFAHGNPTSSYLWRNVMPHLEGLGRLVAADMIGMGGSDKLSQSGPDRYNYDEQRDYLFALRDALDLGGNVTLVLHDWAQHSSSTGPASTANTYREQRSFEQSSTQLAVR